MRRSRKSSSILDHGMALTRWQTTTGPPVPKKRKTEPIADKDAGPVPVVDEDGSEEEEEDGDASEEEKEDSDEKEETEPTERKGVSAKAGESDAPAGSTKASAASADVEDDEE